MFFLLVLHEIDNASANVSTLAKKLTTFFKSNLIGRHFNGQDKRRTHFLVLGNVLPKSIPLEHTRAQLLRGFWNR